MSHRAWNSSSVDCSAGEGRRRHEDAASSETARDEHNNLRQPGQTMALKKAFGVRCAEAEVPRNPINANALALHDVQNLRDELER